MKNLFTLLFVFFLYSADAANYYFSAVSGDDSRSSAQARSASTPWKTLGKLNSFFSSLQPGDSVLLKRGETFFGSITVNKSGTSALPVVISAYGTGNKPVITSLVTLTSWVSKGNGIWESYNSSLGSTLNIVLINGAVQQIGRYPNKDAANKGYLTLESHTSNSITDNELSSAPNWTGAEMVIRARRWVTDRCLITNHSGRTITYIKGSSYGANDDYGYFIQNDIKTLDKFGEWYYNPSVKKLSIYFGANAPSSYTIQAATIQNLISADSYKYIVFDNLNVKGANADGINVRSGSNMRIKNCDIAFSGGNGAIIKFHTYLTMENCTVSYSNDNGINLGYQGDYATIRNNKITNTSVFAGMGGNGDGKGFGIHSNGSNTIIEYNEVINTGYSAINFNGDYTLVKNNYINGFCITKDDGSGIYTFTGSANTARTGRKVIGNIVMNGVGTPEGINENKPLAEGIYMDDNTSGVEISGNTITNVPGQGIFLHNARGITITNNTSFNNNVQFLITHDTKGDAVRNCIITKNTFFSKFSSQTALSLRSIANDNNLIGRFDSNYYARPIDDRLVISNSYVNSSGSRITENLDLEGWKGKYNKDAASKRTAKQISLYRLKSIISSNKIANGAFTSNGDGVYKSYCTTSWSNAGLLDGGYLQVTPSAKNSSVYMTIGGLTAGKKYLVKYSVRGVDNNMSISTFLRQNGSPYNTLTTIQNRKISTARTNNEMLFLSSTTETAARITFRADNLSKYYLDNIQVYEADAAITNIDDSIRFEYNPTLENKTVDLDGNYVDAKNNKYSNSIELKPYASAVLIKDGGAIATNTPPTVSITSPVTNATFAAPASVTISAAAADSDGTISKVEFYNGNTLLGTDNTSPYTFTWNNAAAGSYSITAKATDNGSRVTTSAAVAISVYPPNVAPSVSITNPIANATFAAPASVTISAVAADVDGTISKVEFYNGNTLLGTDNTSPYTFTWNNVQKGNYSITAKATDNGSLITASSAVAISVYMPNVAPSVSITSPVTNATFASPASVTISAIAADIDGTISKVEFYNGNTLLGTDNTSPYTFTWNNVQKGNYSITAKATDNGSLVTASAAVAFTVTASGDTLNVAPSVSITSPVTNDTFSAPASVNISAVAADADGSVSKVEFYNNDTLLGTATASPYTYTWNNVTAGNYSITAKATDNSSLVTASAAVVISVYTPNVAPSVSITSPVTNATFAAPASVTINAVAADTDGTISKVEFYNNDTLLGTDSISPYTYTMTNVAPGNYFLAAKAADNKGLTSSSAIIEVAVLVANKAPLVSITSPTNNAIYTAPATITLSASATDEDGTITKVQFYKGGTLLGTDNISPYTYTMTNVASGNYSFTAKATDNKGLFSSSSSISVAVSVAANKAPVVSITSPAHNAIYDAPATITINAAATDDDGTIRFVKFYNGGTLLTTDSISPYTYTMTNVAPGNYSLVAKATDNKGLTSSSASVGVAVLAANKAPLVSITSPTNNAIYTAPAKINMSAIASDADGTISKVEFYNGTTLLVIERSAPYTYSWLNVPAGTYTIIAKATDNKGAVTTSAGVTVSVAAQSAVLAANKAPLVSITSPTNNAIYTAPAKINMSAIASDADGTISKVEFYNGTTLLVIEKYAPYTYSWLNVPAGTYTIIAKATDNKGAVTTSAGVTVSVAAQSVNLRSSVNNDTSGVTNNVHALNLKHETVSKEDHGTYTVKVFPNPAVDKIQINLAGLQINNKKANLSIQNLSGIIVKNIPVVLSGKTIEADVSSLRAGMYIVSIISDDFKISRKFMKN